MTDTGLNSTVSGGRRLACTRCGAEFSCNLHGPCWCGEEAVKLPLPKPGEPSVTGFDDCLCRDCLRAVTAEYFARTSR